MRSVIFAVSTALTVLLSACTGAASSVPVNTVSSVSASTSITTSSEVDSAVSESASSETGNIQTGLVREQTLDSTEGLIHYSYYLPEDYDPTRKYPMMVVMPGYNMMWFGESSSGSNLDWTGFTSWTNLGQDMIVVSAQLTDWGDTSARQAIALTEYFINHFAVDTARIYAAGYSAGGETMSRAVAMRPDLYAAYYPSEEFVFSSYGCDLHIDNELVANAFAALPKQEQSILILFCVLELGDGEIGDLMGMSRSAVQRHRTKTLNELQKKLKAHLPEGG